MFYILPVLEDYIYTLEIYGSIDMKLMMKHRSTLADESVPIQNYLWRVEGFGLCD